MHSLATPPLLMSVEGTNSIEPVVVWPLFQNNSTELVLDLPGHSAANCYSCSSSLMLLIFIISLLCKCRIFLFLTCRLWLVAGHLFASLSSNSPNCPIFVCLVLISILRITKNMFVSTGSPRHIFIVTGFALFCHFVHWVMVQFCRQKKHHTLLLANFY